MNDGEKFSVDCIADIAVRIPSIIEIDRLFIDYPLIVFTAAVVRYLLSIDKDILPVIFVS